jgi:type II secretory pathway component GspD/PulD (secretin)
VDAQVVEIELNDEHASGIDWRAVRTELTGTASPAGRRSRALTGLRATDAAKLLELLASQGQVTVLANPSLLAVNNEPAIVRTDAMTLSVTPQAGDDGAIMLSVTPILRAPAPQEADMLARVADGETLVLAGFTRERELRERKHLGTSGGWFGRGTVVTKKKVELVILLTPRVVVGVNAQ